MHDEMEGFRYTLHFCRLWTARPNVPFGTGGPTDFTGLFKNCRQSQVPYAKSLLILRTCRHQEDHQEYY